MVDLRATMNIVSTAINDIQTSIQNLESDLEIIQTNVQNLEFDRKSDFDLVENVADNTGNGFCSCMNAPV